MKKLLFTFFLLLGALALGAKVKLPSLVGDNMVLQQQTNARLWGWAAPGATVRVTTSWDGKNGDLPGRQRQLLAGRGADARSRLHALRNHY